MRRKAPSRRGILRRVAHRVLARELVGDLAVDVLQLVDLLGEERAAAGFLRELAQHELGFAESLERAGLARLQADRVDRRLRSLRQLEHFLEADQARRVFAVRQHDDRLAANLVGVLRLDLGELLQRDVDGVVQRRRSARARWRESPTRARRPCW